MHTSEVNKHGTEHLMPHLLLKDFAVRFQALPLLEDKGLIKGIVGVLYSEDHAKLSWVVSLAGLTRYLCAV